MNPSQKHRTIDKPNIKLITDHQSRKTTEQQKCPITVPRPPRRYVFVTFTSLSTNKHLKKTLISPEFCYTIVQLERY